MDRNMKDRRIGSSSLRRWMAAGVLAGAVAFSGASALAQDKPEQAAKAPATDAAAQGERWLRVVEEDGGETLKLQLVSREYRLADGAGPSVYLTGAVHIADEVFYKELQEYLDKKDVVLFEGVKPPGTGRLDHGHFKPDDESLAETTKHRIRLIATLVEKHHRTHKEYPKSFDELLGGLEGKLAKIMQSCTTDAWGNAFVYTLKQFDADAEAQPRPLKGSARFEITSLGADGKVAGEGLNADIAFSDQAAIKRNEITEGEGIQRQMATALRLKFQLDAMDDTKPNWRNSDMSVDQVMDLLEESGANQDQLFSMLGGGSFLDTVIGGIARLVGRSTTISTMLKMGMIDMLTQADQLTQGLEGDMGKMMKVIIEDRNKVVMNDLARIMRDEPEIKTVGIIYGAGHLPDLEERMKNELQLSPVGEEWFTAITIKVKDAGMSAKEARETRNMMKSQIQRQLKAMQRKQK